MITQVTLKELLVDPYYRKWLTKTPTLTVHGVTDPWRLFIQKKRDGPWARRDYPTYTKAYTQLGLRLPECYDAALHSKRQHFAPPMVKFKGKKLYIPLPPGHIWCELCRRATVLGNYTRHPNIHIPSNPEWRRCTICGMRAVAMKEYPSRLTWPLTKPKKNNDSS